MKLLSNFDIHDTVVEAIGQTLGGTGLVYLVTNFLMKESMSFTEVFYEFGYKLLTNRMIVVSIATVVLTPIIWRLAKLVCEKYNRLLVER